ncbi:hypothetical protein AB0G15_38400 [Streptosporangium sp. NPDC023825]|uniref:hypothetical protein n=1 Tax=Streptosporangium sp. NPDC023825 TaxID=3154909 RepID=UPI00342111BE
MLELRASKPTIVMAQLGAAWTVGAITLPLVWRFLPVAATGGGENGLVLLALLGTLLVLAHLTVVITATRRASALGATVAGRVLWVLLVLGAGTAGWALSWAATDVAGLGVSRSGLLSSLLGGIPFVLAAGMSLRGRLLGLTALGLSVVLVGACVVVLRQESPDEFEARLATAGVRRETTYVVAVPGYRPNGGRDYGRGLGDGGFLPGNPDAIPPDRHITITAYDRLMVGEKMCGQPTALDSRLTWGSCTAEPGGLVYRNNEIVHGYQVPVGRRYVTVVGTPSVDHDLLRAAALNLRLATARELGAGHGQTGDHYAAKIPGYAGQPAGIPAGMIYLPSDRTGIGAQSVAIHLYVTYEDGEGVCFRAVECTPEGAGLTYVRHEDTHGYMTRRGEVNVQVLGGLRVGGTTLRQATLNARPVTEEELRRVLPPLQPRHTVDRLRRWLRTF